MSQARIIAVVESRKGVELMRDRLIELLKLPSNCMPHTKCESCGLNGGCSVQRQADKIINDGWMRPPCKVGDTVYFNHAELNETCPAKVIKITNNYYTPSMPLWITIEYESKLIGRQEVETGSDVFELLCFPTKEEAEQKLKGGEQE